ncbi:hypothetical protein CH063_00209, partial [Colletotrichum higginsianum]
GRSGFPHNFDPITSKRRRRSANAKGGLPAADRGGISSPDSIGQCSSNLCFPICDPPKMLTQGGSVSNEPVHMNSAKADPTDSGGIWYTILRHDQRRRQ